MIIIKTKKCKKCLKIKSLDCFIKDNRLKDGIRNICKEWRKEVYKRYNYTCQCCGDNTGGNLNAHHLDGYEWCIEKRIDIDNGITLCEKCHKEFHCLYGRKNNTYSEFQEFLNLKNKYVNTEVSDNFKRLHHRNA